MSQIDENRKFTRSNRKRIRHVVKFFNIVMAVTAIVRTINTVIAFFHK